MPRATFRRVLVLVAAALLAATAAHGQVGPGPTDQTPASPPAAAATSADGSQPPTPPASGKPEVTVTAPRVDRTLPTLAPDKFTNCLDQIGLDTLERAPTSGLSAFYMQASICEFQLDREKHIVIEACLNGDGKTAVARIIQACTELLDNNIIHGRWRSYVLVNRAGAYFSADDKARALADYDAAVKLAPRNAELLYNRGVFYAVQSNEDAALRDFDAAIGIDAKLVPALRQRAKIYEARGNFERALADYSEAIRLQPKTAALWSERGYVSLRHHDYASAVKDEAEAIRLDPKLARAYYLRGAALGDLGDSRGAVGDLTTAVQLDPALDQYVKSNGKTAFITLPPL